MFRKYRLCSRLSSDDREILIQVLVGTDMAGWCHVEGGNKDQEVNKTVQTHLFLDQWIGAVALYCQRCLYA